MEFLSLWKGCQAMASTHPPQPYGYKVFESPHKERVMGLLLLKRGYNHCIRWLADHGLKVTYRTLKSFEQNYMGNLEQAVQDKLKKAILDEEGREEAKVAEDFVSNKLSTIDTYKRVIVQVQKQIEILEKRSLLTDDQTKILGQYYRNLLDYRKELEIHDKESEVELTRKTVLKEVSLIALTIMKGDEAKQREFISKVEQYAQGTRV